MKEGRNFDKGSRKAADALMKKIKNTTGDNGISLKASSSNNHCQSVLFRAGIASD